MVLGSTTARCRFLLLATDKHNINPATKGPIRTPRISSSVNYLEWCLPPIVTSITKTDVDLLAQIHIPRASVSGWPMWRNIIILDFMKSSIYLSSTQELRVSDTKIKRIFIITLSGIRRFLVLGVLKDPRGEAALVTKHLCATIMSKDLEPLELYTKGATVTQSRNWNARWSIDGVSRGSKNTFCLMSIKRRYHFKEASRKCAWGRKRSLITDTKQALLFNLQPWCSLVINQLLIELF